MEEHTTVDQTSTEATKEETTKPVEQAEPQATKAPKPLQAEGNQAYKKIQDDKLAEKIAELSKLDGVRIQFNDAKNGREVFIETIKGHNDLPKQKATDIIIHNSVSVQKYDMATAKKFVKFFAGRAEIVA